MKYEELQERISKLTAENFQAELIDILKDVKQDYATRDSLVAKNAENEDRIRTLQDTNARLFIGQVGNVDDKSGAKIDDLDEEDGDEFIDTFFDELGGEENE